MSSECADELAVQRMHERCIELAAMFKEHVKGGSKMKKRILSRFCLQEGVNIRKATNYFNLLKDSGLIKYTDGHKSWRYDPKEEWELFHVEI